MTETDELRRMLDERGVEWGNIRDDGSESDYLTEWQFEDNQGEAIAIEWSVGSGLHVETHRYNLTPEQAIAATLGADASPTQAESSGTLTAEKVRELMEENSRQYPSPTDPYVWLTEYDWQAIADELNDTLGSFNYTNSERTDRTCRDVCNGVSEFTCSACGFNCDLTSWISLFDGDDGRHRHHHHGTPNYCPNCGRRVEVDE